MHDDRKHFWEHFLLFLLHFLQPHWMEQMSVTIWSGILQRAKHDLKISIAMKEIINFIQEVSIHLLWVCILIKNWLFRNRPIKSKWILLHDLEGQDQLEIIVLCGRFLFNKQFSHIFKISCFSWYCSCFLIYS